MHSVLKQFKKFGTSSAQAVFKRKMTNGWNFVIEQTLHLDKEGNISDKKQMEEWKTDSIFSRLSTHDAGHYVDPRLKAMMNRSGGFKFIVRHNNKSPCGPEMILKNDIGNAICWVQEAGC